MVLFIIFLSSLTYSEDQRSYDRLSAHNSFNSAVRNYEQVNHHKRQYDSLINTNPQEAEKHRQLWERHFNQGKQDQALYNQFYKRAMGREADKNTYTSVSPFASEFSGNRVVTPSRTLAPSYSNRGVTSSNGFSSSRVFSNSTGAYQNASTQGRFFNQNQIANMPSRTSYSRGSYRTNFNQGFSGVKVPMSSIRGGGYVKHSGPVMQICVNPPCR